MKPGRNQPCPCGSGKKYKHCCLRAEVTASEQPANLASRRLQRLSGEFRQDIVRFIDRTYGPEALEEAWSEFVVWRDDEAMSGESPHLVVFMPWFFHRWAPDPLETVVRDAALHDVPPTAAYLAAKGRRLDPMLREYLESCVATPFSFFEVVHSDPGHGCRVQDVLLGQAYEVAERSASENLQAGDILFAQLGRAGGTVVFEACSLVAIPPIHKIAVVELRDHIREHGEQSGAELLHEWDMEIRGLYLDLVDEVFYPELPELANTDGEPLALQTLVFEVDSAESAYEALKFVALGEQTTEADLIEDAERDADGALQRIRFSWSRHARNAGSGPDSVVLAFVDIDGRTLKIDVNSDSRAQAARELVESALGSRARYRVTTFHSVERLLEDARDKGPPPAGLSSDELALLPEVRAHVSAMLEAHYDGWVNETIPALGNRTPLQAIRTRDGREKVEALVHQIERDGARQTPPLDPAIIERLRQRLGLE